MRSPEVDEREATPLDRRMAALLRFAALLVFLAGVQLFVFTDRTERYFAWTVDPPLTAAFLGASYWSAVAFELRAGAARRWADARIAVPAVFVFTALTLVVTLVHLDRFHLGDEHGAGTQAVTWAWIGIYATVPVLMAVVAVVQLRGGTADPPVAAPMPPVLAAAVAAQAAVFLVYGAALLAAPTDAARWWPWPLTELTGRAIGAWLFSLGIAAVHAIAERDLRRLAPAATAYVVFGLLQGVALARYPGTPDWGDPEAIAYVVVLASTVLTGAAALALGRRPRITAAC